MLSPRPTNARMKRDGVRTENTLTAPENLSPSNQPLFQATGHFPEWL